jgi:hypothetical protein
MVIAQRVDARTQGGLRAIRSVFARHQGIRGIWVRGPRWCRLLEMEERQRAREVGQRSAL